MGEFPAFPLHHWLLIIWAGCCGGLDCVYRRLPNVLTLGGITVALALLALTGRGWLGSGWISSLSAALAAILLTVPAYFFRLLGAGDVKMLIAVGMLGGLEALLVTYAFAGLAIGLAAMIWIRLYHWQAWFAHYLASFGIQQFSVPEPKSRQMPFGLGLAFGFILAIAAGPNPLFLF